MAVDPAALRNVAVVGHRGCGKTSLVEAMLHVAGAISRMGSIPDGNTVSDWDEDERRREMSIQASICHLDWQGRHVTLVDTPGEPSFHADTMSSFRAADAALVVVNATAGIQVQTARLWNQAAAAGLARLIVITMLERERADFDACVGALRALDAQCVPVQLPIVNDGRVTGVVNLVSMTGTTYPDGALVGVQGPIPEELRGDADDARTVLVETVAESDDELIEKYLADEEITTDELIAGLKRVSRKGRIFPIMCAAPTWGIGADRIVNAIVSVMPSPLDAGVTGAVDASSGERADVPLRVDGPPVAYCFKTLADPFSGKINLLRVLSGTLHSDTQLQDARTGAKERIGQLMRMQGKEHANVVEAAAGEIVAVAKLKDVVTGDLLAAGPTDIAIAPIPFAPAVMSFAITPKVKGEEDKVVQSLRRLGEEDPTLDLHRDEQTGELIVAGVSQMHVEATIARMHRRFGVGVELHPPRVPYRETVSTEAQAEGKHKKQSGGRGQFGDCWLRIEPLPRGSGVEFVDKIVGGAIPRPYIPAVERGVIEAAAQGVLAGFPVVDVRVTAYDGKHHPVDSSEMAFKIAGALGMKAVLEKANPVLLEPIMQIAITVPEEHVGDVMGDLSGRRGQPQGMEASGHTEVIRAEVPLAEMLSYAVDLRAMTGGRGDFTMEFLRYDEVPAHIAQKTVEAVRSKAA
ncbi:MAG: elongation factor G [Actinobacteria bacterium]|nr:elongation factor G [Actinomycetota bacterium]